MNDPNDGSSPARDRRRSSQVLREFKDTHTGERVTLGELRDALGDRAFGVLLFIFSLPNLVPNIPGMSTIFAIPLLFLSWQFSYGRPYPWFPRWLSQRSFLREDFIGALARGAACGAPPPNSLPPAGSAGGGATVAVAVCVMTMVASKPSRGADMAGHV